MSGIFGGGSSHPQYVYLPPIPPPPPPNAATFADARRNTQREASMNPSSFLGTTAATGPGGLQGPADTTRKTLLGA